MGSYLETERLVLRRFTERDLGELVELDSDPVVMRYLTGGRPTPLEEIRDVVLPFWLAYYERGEELGFWAAVEKTTGRFVGWFHFRPRPDGPSAGVELGYRLRRDAWGRGYATEGSRALLRKGFTELGVERVYAETMAVNTGSRRVMEKAGLRYIRTFHQDWPERIPGDEHGDVEYALTRAEWLAQG
ncbi:GNAT family N-acetyltransferase [Amorphoplanes nipponensis]|uniref:GNAT family acetyltransferase n=1 Tax=Actinoplanes nipponensis TaxID=135950 RepID=A0A919JDJ7_9ACTN|nr:GNAT family N-acetyltransferase [Actinoplanes nipponensis]GIE47813.1 GNAT family acetyltransferase [Actinoplanes nipponensis]